MKNFFYLFIIFLVLFSCGGDDEEIVTDPEWVGLGYLGTFNGNVVLNSQQEVDDFGAEQFVEVVGS
jgi:hypothetical protein